MRPYLAGLALVAVALCSSAPADEKPTSAEELAAQWAYPGAKKLSSHAGGPLATGLYVTTDDRAKVLKYYGDKLGLDLSGDKTAAPGGVAEDKEGEQTASFDDSFLPYDDKRRDYAPRDVSEDIVTRNTKDYTLTLIVTRVKGESHTHIALTCVKK